MNSYYFINNTRRQFCFSYDNTPVYNSLMLSVQKHGWNLNEDIQVQTDSYEILEHLITVKYFDFVD